VGLQVFWFCLIGVLWAGYFLLEGFDFGVGMLLAFLPRRGSEDRSVMFESIGPVWDGNEVWLVVAAGATFAAFPVWYATVFSGFYIALLVVLVLLIVRVVSFEWREKRDGPRWRTAWSWANTVGSAVPAFIWGVALANFLHGVPVNASHGYGGDFFDLFSAYTVLAGLTVVVLFAFHGATYLTVRTVGELRQRASAAARGLSLISAALTIGFVAWTVVVAHDRNGRGILPTAIPALVTAAALLSAVVFTRMRRSGWAFAMTGIGAIGIVATLFTGLYPRVLVSDPVFANSLTIENAASGHYALQVMTVAAAIFTPIVVLYQCWTYYVFRKRLGGAQIEPAVSEPSVATLAGRTGGKSASR
jgi:cytochrome d ubiquinol oxidase subunit II